MAFHIGAEAEISTRAPVGKLAVSDVEDCSLPLPCVGTGYHPCCGVAACLRFLLNAEAAGAQVEVLYVDEDSVAAVVDVVV